MTKEELGAIMRGLALVLRDYMTLVQAKDRGLDGAGDRDGVAAERAGALGRGV